MLSPDDKKRIEAEEEYRVQVRNKIPGNIQKTDLGQLVWRVLKTILIIWLALVGLAILIGLLGAIGKR